ncbi:MAG TPA: RDD family protein [Pyrinomonadaceae bacterium]|nr:RDD family protein [Pyrinomonadaceae bacterium]
MTENSNATPNTAPSAPSSTLIEFPGVNRNRPAWRKELSERFREIQQRRARDSAPETEDAPRRAPAEDAPEQLDAPAAPAAKQAESTKQPRLVPQPEPQELNPIVQAALRRVERARRQTATAGRGAGGRAAAAVARAVEEEVEAVADARPEPAPVAQPEPQPARQQQALEKSEAKAEPQAEAARPAPLSVVLPRQPEQAVAPAPATKVSPAAEAPKAARVLEADAAIVGESEEKPKPRKVSGVIDDHWLERRGVDPLPKVEAQAGSYDDRAPLLKRVSAAAVDLVAVAFLTAPCAAVIELTIGNWGDPSVLSSMGGIVAVLMFLYHTCSVALAGRTLGMRLFSLHAVDADTARVPTTGQCMRRALFYIVSLAAFGLGILYALFDAERRTAHDLLSGTVVVKE